MKFSDTFSSYMPVKAFIIIIEYSIKLSIYNNL